MRRLIVVVSISLEDIPMVRNFPADLSPLFYLNKIFNVHLLTTGKNFALFATICGHNVQDVPNA